MTWTRARVGLALALAASVVSCTYREKVPAPLSPLTVTADEAFRYYPPALEASLELRPPTERVVDLENGLRIMVVERHDLPIAALVFANRAARDGESVGELGLAALTAGTLDGGTFFESGEVFAGLRVEGRPLRVSAVPDGTLVGFEAFSSALPDAIRLLGRWVRYPALTDGALQVGLTMQAAAASSSENNLLLPLRVAALERLYGRGHALAVGQLGARAHWRPLRLPDVQSFYRRTYQPATSALVVVGDVETDRVIELARAQFGTWVASGPPLVPEPSPRLVRHRELEITGIARGPRQAVFTAVIPCPGLTDPDALAGDLLAIVLGQMTLSRTSVRLRHDTGASYTSRATCLQRRNFGELSIVVSSQSDRARLTLETILAEIRKLKAELISPTELETAKARLLARHAEQIASSPALAGGLASNFLSGMPADFYATLVGRVRALTAERVRSTALRYFDEASLGVAVAGDPRIVGEELRALGRIRWDFSEERE